MKAEKEESKETYTDEKNESQETQAKEEAEGTEMHKALVPEQFQKECAALIDSCDNKACLAYLRERVYEKEDELRRAEEAKKSKGKKNGLVPTTYSSVDMPAD